MATQDHFCVEIDDSTDVKIVAVQIKFNGDEASVCNPNESCAGDSLDALWISCPASHFGSSGGQCGEAFIRKECE